MLPKPDGQSPKLERLRDSSEPKQQSSMANVHIPSQPCSPKKDKGSKSTISDSLNPNGAKLKEHSKKLCAVDESSPGARSVNGVKLKDLSRTLGGESSPGGRLTRSNSKGSKPSVCSPARSIDAPSEFELEYDDFVEDDPLSYFDYEETQKLNFRGAERIDKKRIVEDEEEEAEV